MADEDRSKLPYWDNKLPIDQRVDDLISRMTLEEKAGQLFHDMIITGPDGGLAGPMPAFGLDSTEASLTNKQMTHFNLLGPVTDAKLVAEWHNTLQRFAQKGRLGIPITLSTDPRNHFSENVGASFRAGLLSQWPETLGFAALGSPELVERFADIARQEYVAIGLRVALHPQIDLATEPRWARINATFGEDADLSGDLGAAYIRGFQGSKLGPQSVATMTKHFPGGGPQQDGEDPHFDYGKEQVYPGNNFDYHLNPFKKALKAGTSQIMPYYGMPVGTEYEEVGFGLNKGIITDLLRDKLGFEGIVCTDWGLVTGANILGQDMPARCWGAEHLSEEQLVQKILEAGCDQFGGESAPHHIVKLVRDGKVPESRIDISVRRLLKEKFTLGLFDNPFVDVDAAVRIVGNSDFTREGEVAQRRSFTLLKNTNDILPLNPTEWQHQQIHADASLIPLLQARGFTNLSSETITDSPSTSPAKPALSLIRLRTPYDPRPGGFESMFHAGSLSFPPDVLNLLLSHLTSTPTIVDLYLDRPACIPEIADSATALLANYGASGDAFLDIVFGTDGVKPEGKLPFDLPRSMEAVRRGKSDVPFDTEDPVFRFGDGMSYAL